MNRSLAFATVFGLLTLANQELRGQTLPINAQLTVQSQDQSLLSGTTFTDRLKTTKLKSADLLSLLAPGYQADFPDGFPFGARLMLVDFSFFQVQSFDGAVLVTNVSDFLTYSDTYATEGYLFKGKENTNTLARSHTFIYNSTIQFTDPSTNGLTFLLTGTTQERYSISTEDQSGLRKYQDSMTLNVMGYGTNNFGFSILSGKLTTGTVKWIE